MIVIDASLVIDVITAKIRSNDLASILAEGQISAPELLDLEVAQGLRKIRMLQKATDEECTLALALLKEMPIVRVPHAPLISRIWELRGNMTAYDAAYVALAEQLGVELWTSDAKYSRTPGHNVKIRHIQPAP